VKTTELLIAAFGSWREPNDQKVNEGLQGSSHAYQHYLSRQDFEKACRQLGAEVSESGHRIFVASDSPSTIDYHIVQGVLESADRQPPLHPPIILVRSAARRSSKGNEDCSKIYNELLCSRPELFEPPINLPTNNWEDVHDHISGKCNRVLILGGGASSHRIAVRALAAGKIVVPVGAFGGAGEEVTQMLEGVRDDRNFPKYEYRKVLANSTWTDAQLNTTLYALGVKSDPQQRSKIFINYRRSDSDMMASLIYNSLCNAFSKEVIFLDKASIYAGDHFESVIVSALSVTRTFVSIFGPDWLKTTEQESGQRRLDAPLDYVRREIEIALRDGLRVIPVSVNGANVPDAKHLPESISKLFDHHVHFISANQDEQGVSALVERIKKLMNDDSS
jgi:hypothetical protein